MDFWSARFLWQEPLFAAVVGAALLGYLPASAMVIVVLSSPRIAQEAHEIGDLLFGNAVVVKHEHLIQLCIAAAVVFTIHRLFFKDFLFCSYEPETARSMRYPVRWL